MNDINYKKAIQEADNILLSSFQNEFPLNIKKLIKDIKTNNIELMPYSATGIDDSKDIKVSGFVIEKQGIYYVLYNDYIESEGHIRFTLLHELGHIILKHDSKVKSKSQDIEADIFAAELLMPEAIIDNLIKRGYNIIDEASIEKIFNASHKACEIRIGQFKKLPEWHIKYTDYDSIANIQFRKYLDENFPSRTNYQYDIEKEIEEERERDSWR